MTATSPSEPRNATTRPLRNSAPAMRPPSSASDRQTGYQPTWYPSGPCGSNPRPRRWVGDSVAVIGTSPLRK